MPNQHFSKFVEKCCGVKKNKLLCQDLLGATGLNYNTFLERSHKAKYLDTDFPPGACLPI